MNQRKKPNHIITENFNCYEEIESAEGNCITRSPSTVPFKVITKQEAHKFQIWKLKCDFHDLSSTNAKYTLHLMSDSFHKLLHRLQGIDVNNRPACEEISMVLDVYSVLITSNDTDRGKEWLRKYLLTLGGGEGLTICSLPRRCNSSGSQHTPPFLRGNEIMLVVDSPIKIALHVSCQEKLMDCLKGMGFYFTAAPSNSGLCFDPNLHPYKPPYYCMVEAIISACKVRTGMHKGTNLVHVAKSGIRMPLPDPKLTSMIFPNKDDAEGWGTNVEVIIHTT